MKKTILLAILAAVIFSCGPSKTVQESKKVIKGYWSLDNISYSESGNFNVQLFNDASKECFEGSSWRFIPNNNTGNYSIESGDCPTGQRYFIFSILEIDATSGLYDFMLKPTNEKKKSETNAGIRLRLAQLTDTAMQWQQTVSLEGKPFTIYMNFSKINE
jgi:hypothetical protein